MKKLLVYIRILPLLFLSANLAGQEAFSYTYGLKDGLPYQDVVRVYCSRDGVLWTWSASCEYISRFDGVNWEHFNVTRYGMPAYMHFKGEDVRGNLWLEYRNIDKTLLAWYHPSRGFRIQEFPSGVYCDFEEGGEVICVDSSYTLNYAYSVASDTFFRQDTPVVNKVPGFYFENKYNTLNSIEVARYVNIKEEAKYYSEVGELALPPDPQHLFPLLVYAPDDVIFFDIKNLEYFRYTNGRKTHIPILGPNGAELTPRYFIILYYNGLKNITFDKGLVCSDPETGYHFLVTMAASGKPQIMIHYLPREGIYSATSDATGNWWLATNRGVMYVNPHLLTFTDEQTDMVEGLFSIGEDSDGYIWMGGHEGVGGFSVYDGYQLRYENFGQQSLKILPGSLLTPSGHLYFSTASPPRRMISIKNGRATFQGYSKNSTQLSAFYFTSLRKGGIGIGSVNLGLVLAEDSSGWLINYQIIDEDKGLEMNDVGTVAEDLAGRLWLGRLPSGLALYDPAKDTVVNWPRVPENDSSLGIMSSLVDEKGTLWLGTNNGLYFLKNAHLFDYNIKNIWSYLTPFQLPGNDNTLVASLKNTEFFISVGTERALYLLDKTYAGKRPRIFTLEFGKDIQGGGAEQNAVWYDSKGYLWLGTQEGATRVDVNNLLFDTLPTNIAVSNFKVGGEDLKLSENSIGSLPLNKRAVSFNIFAKGNHFLRDNLKYDVIVVHEGRDTIYEKYQTTEKSHVISYLPPGEYTLQLTAYKHNVVVGQAQYQLKVPALPTEQPWFYGILALLLVGLPAWMFIQKKRHELKLEKARRESDSLRILALSNFFNPHFINNALHWIQSRYRKDPETATIIGRLSDNVNILYENSQRARPWHSLYRELEVVKNYLRIQQVRFGSTLKTEFDISLSAEELKLIKVPAMLLQIHAENAVEKGIRNRKEAGRFFLQIKCREEGCHIVIEDDGRGRVDKTNPRKGSTFIMNELIQLFNNYNKTPVTIEYDDFIYGDHGTRVRIFVPKNFNYELSKTENTRR